MNWKNLVLVGLAVLLGAITHMAYGQVESRTAPKLDSDTSLEWNFGLGGRFVQESLDEATWAYATFSARGERGLIPERFLVLGDIWVNARTGQQQDRFQRFETDSFGIREFVAELRWGEEFAFQAGAVNQGFLRSDILVESGRAFPGLKQQLSYGGETAQVKVMAQQSVPTSSSLNTNLSEKEPTPSFLTQSVELELKYFAPFKWSVFGTHYRFNQLPSIVAAESRLRGNAATNGEEAPAAEFTTDFTGINLGTEFCFCPKQESWWVRLGTQYLENFDAPEKSNRSQSLFLTTKMSFGSYSIEPQAEYFFVESDVVPAFYSSRWRGYTNREGQAVRLKWNFEKYGFSLVTGYVQANEINDISVQDDLRAVELYLETNYVAF